MVPQGSALLLGLRLWQHLAGLADEQGEVVTVIDVGDVEMILGPFVRRLHVDGTQQRTDGLCGFQIEAIVADESENLSVAINAIVAKHLLGDDLASPSALVSDILNKVYITCHTLF